MEIYATTITVSSSSAFQYIDVTDEVQKAVETSGVRQGLALLYEMHTTGALVIQEADKSVHRDTQEIFDELISTTEPRAFAIAFAALFFSAIIILDIIKFYL